MTVFTLLVFWWWWQVFGLIDDVRYDFKQWRAQQWQP